MSTVEYVNPKLGYNGNPTFMVYRGMTVEEAKRLRYGDTVEFLDTKGQVRHAKVNDAPKTWKRCPERVEVSLKYGLYEYARYNEQDIVRLLVPVRNIAEPDTHLHAFNHAKYNV